MGQTTSTAVYSPGGSSDGTSSPAHRRSSLNQSETLHLMLPKEDNGQPFEVISGNQDHTWEIPDECLALIFQSLSSGDRKRCSLVCRRWFCVEGQSRHRLALNAQADILPHIPSIFSRFDSVTKLALRCDRKSVSINDEALDLISLRCRNLTRLKLRGCRDVTDLGMAALAKNCASLRKFSCGSCMFGAKGMNALLNNCSSLEELSVKRLRGINDGVAAEPIGPGVAAASLKSICLKELFNGQCFGPLIIGSKNLRTLKLLRCLGDWDRLLETLANRRSFLVEVHLERLQVGDVGLTALSKCSELETLHLVKVPECTNAGVMAVAEHCKLLRKLHIDGWRTNRIGNEGLIAIAKNSTNLQELVLIGLNPTLVSVSAIASNCQKLERLALCGSETMGDDEISCVANKCLALKKLCIKGCNNVSNQGIESFAWGCPNLVKIKIKKCRRITGEVGDWLRVRRRLLTVNLDGGEVEVDAVDATASDGGAQEEGMEFPSIASEMNSGGIAVVNAQAPSTSNGGRSSSSKSRFGFFGGRNLVGCTFRRWSNGNNGSGERL